MIKLRLTSLILLATLMLGSVTTNAQDAKTSSGSVDPMSDLYIVLGAGAAGAILGLSTLSFASEPSKKIKNVSMGAAVGIILGVGIVIYNQATRASTEIYTDSQNYPLSPERFAQESRLEFSESSVFDSFRQEEWVNFKINF